MSDIKMDLVRRLRKKKGRKGAIDAKCCECIYDPNAKGCGGWRQQVADCTAKLTCPLWDYRPLPVNGTTDEEEINQTEDE